MKLKTATLIALIGTTITYLTTIILHLKHGVHVPALLRTSLYDLPLILFFFTLYRKQQ